MKKILSIFMTALIGIAMVSCVKDEPFPAPPIVSQVLMEPMAPEENQDVVISANISDLNGLKSVKLFYKIGDGAFATVNMSRVGTTNLHTGTIPGQPVGTTVYYYIEAENIINKKTFFPASAPAQPATYKVGGALLIHYWHFNTLSGTVTEVAADFSQLATMPLITYPGEGAGYMDERTHRAADPVSNMNLWLGQPEDEGAVLRVRNPANTRELIIESPTTGYEKIEVKFATTRSGNGAPQQEFYYSSNGGSTWTKVGDAYDVPEVTAWELKTFNLEGITALNNNPNVKFRILFVGEGAANTSGNNRFDNLSVTGEAL